MGDDDINRYPLDPLVNQQFAMGDHHFVIGKSTINGNFQ
jgi:hypothetical protein